MDEKFPLNLPFINLLNISAFTIEDKKKIGDSSDPDPNLDFFLTNLLFCVIPDKKCQEQVPNRDVIWSRLLTIFFVVCTADASGVRAN